MVNSNLSCLSVIDRIKQQYYPTETEIVLQRLASQPPPTYPASAFNFPPRKHASVLVCLFVGRKGDLYVVLSRRSDELRDYPNDTALPGGKADPGDTDEEFTARREAFEEIGLPMDQEKVLHLCNLSVFLSRDKLLVTPVVVLLLDNSIIPVINSDEVAHLFSMPLHYFLLSRSPYDAPASWTRPFPLPITTSASSFSLELSPMDDFHFSTDVAWGSGKVRLHGFLTNREHLGVKPVIGLTASILVEAAMLAFGRPPDYEVYAPEQKTTPERIRETEEQLGYPLSKL